MVVRDAVSEHKLLILPERINTNRRNIDYLPEILLNNLYNIKHDPR